MRPNRRWEDPLNGIEGRKMGAAGSANNPLVFHISPLLLDVDWPRVGDRDSSYSSRRYSLGEYGP
jgi:hypothetical protein